jgi:hypothetical protein
MTCLNDKKLFLKLNKDPRSKLRGINKEKLDLKIPLTPFSKGGISKVTPKQATGNHQ